MRMTLLCSALFSLTMAQAAAANTETPKFAVQAPSEKTMSLAAIEDKWGIRVERLKMTAAGYMVDFRFRVLDPKKAGELFRRDVRPYLVDQVSGAKLPVPASPKVGPLRTTNPPIADKVYFIEFGNRGWVKTGTMVTVVVGDFKLENMIVQ